MKEVSASRLTAFVAIIIAAIMVGTPAAIFGDKDLDPVGVASAADGTRIFKIGVVDMTISTLNPNTYTMVAEGMAIFPMYSYLMQWDKTGDHLVGDLAKEWWYSPDGLTYECELVDTAYFVEYDPDTKVLTKGPNVTSADVKWSIDTLAAEDGSRLNSYWPDFDGVNIIERTWTDSPTHFGITLREPFVPFTESLIGNPIFPKYIWEDEDFVNFDNIPFVGSGAFYYKTDGLPDAGFVELGRNPYWHGDVSFGWQLHVDEFVMVRYDDTNTLYQDLIDGEVHCMMGVDYATYVGDLQGRDNLQGFSQSNGFVYEFNLNQMTDSLRAELGGPLTPGENSQLLLNHTVKKAISMAVNRTELIDEYLYGYGAYTTTLVPSQNPMSHNYGEDGHECLLDPGATEAVQDPVDRVAARNMLWDAGWRYDASGKLWSKSEAGWLDVCPLYNASSSDPDREALSFNFYTLNTASTWEGMCNDIVNWTRAVGVELDLELRSVNDMNSVWYAADYDIWLWDWVLYPYGEAVSSVLSLFTTDVIGTDSDVYISSAEYDAMYNEAIREMDYYKRQEICHDMQDWVYLNRGCQALAFREDLYAFNIDCWENFGDLENEYFLLPDVWPTWLCTQMNAVGNAAPVIGGVSVSNNTPVSGLAEVGTPITFSAVGISDDHQSKDDLEYKWIWGFGGEQQVTSSVVDHTFTEDGEYSITLVVRETAEANGHADYLSSYYTFYLTVHDMSNNAPHSLGIGMSVLDPTAGEVVTFTGTAVDDEDDEMYFSWDFGDGSSVVIGDVVDHQFPAIGSYTVTLMVDDHRFGEPGTRPATESKLVAVGPNSIPSISVPDYGQISVKDSQKFSVLASDPDPRDELRYTWDWGDGTISVTTVPYADHTYQFKGSYVITVYADDLTGLDGHNISDEGTVSVVVSGNNIPAIVSFSVNSQTAFLGETLTFTAIAGDGDGDPLTFTFDFDDGTTYEEDFGATTPNDPVECETDKAFDTAGTYSVYVTVTDDVATALSPEIVVTVAENVAPEITEFAPEPYYDTGVSMDFSVSAYDEDGDSMRYTWEWGDGATTQTIISVATHTYAASGTYTVGVTVDDYKGFSDYAEADVTVNWAPYISPGLTVKSVDEDVSYDYSVSAHDNDADALTCMWDFGDGTPYQFGSAVSHTYADMGTYTYRVYVWDSFVEYRPVTHNATSSSTVNVGSASEDDPPVIEPIGDIYAVEGQAVEIEVYASDDGGEAGLTYIWLFDDGSDPLVADPPVTHVWTTDGEYTLTVWVHDESGIPENNVSATAAVHIENDDPPVADAGGDRTVPEEESVDFTGEASEDDIEVVGYAWTVNDWDGAHSFDTMEFSYTFTLPGTYTVELVVEDSIGQLSAPDEITVTVTDETPPTADAGPDQTVHNGTLVAFSGSGVDGDNYDTDLDFSWTFIYDGALEMLTGETPSFLFEIIGGYTVTLRVEDDAGNYAEDEMILTVADLVDPVADAGADQTVTVGDTVTFDGSGSYDDDTALTYEWEFTYDGSAESLTGVAPTFVFGIADSYEVTLTVTDEGGNTATDTVTITVNEVPNDPPVADAGDDQPDVLEGDTVTFDGSGSSDDVLVTNFTWTFTYDGVDRVLYGVSPTFVFDIAGVYEVTLTVSDAGDLTDSDTVTITVSEPPPAENVPPVADAGEDQTVDQGETVEFDGSGSSDSDGTIVSYAWTFTYDGETKTLTGESPEFTFEIPGEYDVTLTVTDSDGATDTDTVTIVVEEAEDGGSFIEDYGLPIAAIVIVVIVVIVALMLMKRKKGGKAPSPASEPVEGIGSGES